MSCKTPIKQLFNAHLEFLKPHSLEILIGYEVDEPWSDEEDMSDDEYLAFDDNEPDSVRFVHRRE